MQSNIQAAQTMQPCGSPASSIARSDGWPSLDFMSILQVIFARHTLAAAGKECCNLGYGKEQAQSSTNLQTNLSDQFFPVTSDDTADREDAAVAMIASEPVLMELLAMLPGKLLQNWEAGMPQEEDGLPNSFLQAAQEVPAFNNYMNAEIKVDETVLGPEGVTTKPIISNGLPVLPGWLNLTQEQKQQPLQFLNQDHIQQTLKHLEQYLLLAEKPTAPASNAAGVTQNTIEGAATLNNLAPMAEQLSSMLRDLIKSPYNQTPDNRLQTQPVLEKIATSPGINVSNINVSNINVSNINVSNINVKSLTHNFNLNEATTATTGNGAVNGLPNVNTALEPSNNTPRADLPQVALNNFDSIATVTKSMGGETAPASRSIEQPLLMQLAEAIRGQIAKDGLGSTHVRLQLQPESLGEVVIKLVYKDGNVSTHFHAATESVRQIIESSLGQLRETLATHNINLQQSTVTTGGDQGRWAQESNRDQQFNRPGRQSSNGPGAREEIASEPVIEKPKMIYQNRVNHFV
ncbi:MAG TPA: flagellar hook-length control protein FliK [Desulfotomaculum sp.]|nr:MAG: hypothetical protein JL56_05010 [Desulfotomaculum sp. BICA1-6]HBX23701.1 flagellar hook-length control protein FliK [Desulfotomaculum sp.]